MCLALQPARLLPACRRTSKSRMMRVSWIFTPRIIDRAGDDRHLRCPFLVKKLPFAKPPPICGVYLQQANRRSANRTATDNKDSVAFEVLIPPVLPRMKQRKGARRFPDQVHSGCQLTLPQSPPNSAITIKNG